MAKAEPILVFYDHSCPHCRQEMLRFKQFDQQGRLQLIDCSVAGFAGYAGVSQADMMQAMHVLKAPEQWLQGAAATHFLFEYTGFRGMAWLWQLPLMNALYPWIARHRQLLGRIGLVSLLNGFMYFEVKRLQKQMQRCHQGQCDLSSKTGDKS